MQIVPPIEVMVANNIPHGTPVLLKTGGIGLVWQFASVGRLAIGSAKRVLDLTSFETRPLRDVAITETYLPALRGQMSLRPTFAELSHDARSIAPGDLFMTVGMTEAARKIYIALPDPNEGITYGFDFQDADDWATIVQNHILIFKRWRLSLSLSPTETLDIATR